MNTLPAPTQLVAGMTHREMIDIMANAGIFCSVDKFCRILQDAQRRALASTALSEITRASEQMGGYELPTCWCATCRPITLTDMRMVLCPTCGNKRCPHANDHRNECSGSNEAGQPGSAYPLVEPKC
jgi:hypothetical protein